MEQPIPSKKHEPNPKPLVIVLMVVAFLGGSCTVQKMIGGEHEVPTEQDVSTALEKQAGFPKDMTPEARQEVVGAAHHFLEEQVRVTNNLRPFTIAFGIFLAGAYSFVIVLGMRALAFAPGSARHLAVASVAVLPARVAMAAIDIALARNLQPAMAAMARALAAASEKGVPADEAARVAGAVGQGASWLLVAMQGFFAVVVCVLFFYASRYFQRPAVVELYERRAGPPAT